ncbi:MAG: ABC transporter permease [bacterium]
MNQLFFISQQTMTFTIPLLVVALAGLFSEKSGVVNIALEGIMLIGAFFGVLFIYYFQSVLDGQILLLLALLVSALFGALFSYLHAFASITLKADQTISGTALNLFAPAFCIFVARILIGRQQIPFNDSFFIPSVPILSSIPILGGILFTNVYITTYIGLFITFLSYIIINYTQFGIRLRACGENPHAVDSVGVNVSKIRYIAVLISGALSGVGGLIFVIPTSTNFNASVSGYGFLAVAVLIFGQWSIPRVLLASFFFGLMKTFSTAYSSISFLANLNIPSDVYKMLPYIVTLIVLAFTSKSSQAPISLGIPYDKSSK